MGSSHDYNIPGPTDQPRISPISQGTPYRIWIGCGNPNPAEKWTTKGLEAFVKTLGEYKMCGINAQTRVEKLHDFVTRSIRTTDLL
jgi:hypothetical protein